MRHATGKSLHSNGSKFGTPVTSSGEEGAYLAGDIIGTLGINASALLAGSLAPLVWVGYGIAREANREVDAGKPLNPIAIAASGALSAVPGTTATKLPLGLAGRIARVLPPVMLQTLPIEAYNNWEAPDALI